MGNLRAPDGWKEKGNDVACGNKNVAEEEEQV